MAGVLLGAGVAYAMLRKLGDALQRLNEAVELRLSSLAGCMEAVWRC